MAEKIVFGADIDNVTIKNVNGVLTAFVDVENLEDEFEVVTDYVEPVEDDEFYVESTFAKFRHKATQLLTDAYKKEKKPRSAPVNESLSEALVAEVQYNGDSLLFEVPHEHYTSAVDGATLYGTELNTNNVSVTVNKTEYTNAKAFNEAKAGKSFTITTAKRYATSEGHPVVKPTEIQVAYPTLPYYEWTLSPEVSQASYALEYSTHEFDVGITDLSSPAANEFTAFKRLDDQTEHTAHYVITTTDGQEHTGTVQFRGNYFNRFDVPGYRDMNVQKEKWTFEPYTVETFNFKATVSPQPFEWTL